MIENTLAREDNSSESKKRWPRRPPGNAWLVYGQKKQNNKRRKNKEVKKKKKKRKEKKRKRKNKKKGQNEKGKKKRKKKNGAQWLYIAFLKIRRPVDFHTELSLTGNWRLVKIRLKCEFDLTGDSTVQISNRNSNSGHQFASIILLGDILAFLQT